MANYWPEPSAGDIVWCRFPEVVGVPGPKPRPGLVIKVFDDDEPEFAVEIAYGTSQKTNRLHAGEFLIPEIPAAPYKLAGLSYPTKFNLKKLVQLPFNSEWFDLAPGNIAQTPVMGTLHPSLHKAFLAAYHAAMQDRNQS